MVYWQKKAGDDCTVKEKILACLPPDYPWAEYLHWYDSVGSTNDVLKQLALNGAPEGTAVLAARQTNGHGRMGRSFHSPAGKGVYLSLLLRPDCDPNQLLHLTCAVGVAMCRALEESTGLRPGIKWTNDLVYGKRKLGGILTTLGLTSDHRVDYAITGIGINCFQQLPDFPPELQGTATSLSMLTDEPVAAEAVAASMLVQLHAMSDGLFSRKQQLMDSYRSRCITLGQQISLVRGNELRHGIAVDVDADGALVVDFGGHLETVSSGEVSVRGMYGYV